ncbi:PPE domain-containing protein [Actinophytocola sp. NPDC049390]|uniref:PPE domain-containing protein n=1 Tax=Actinophytocola sp. NPDC049390 TaxID=3363894 RepID=UPI0037A1319B
MDQGITIGGCYPPFWPRPPLPPVEEPVPESLDEQVEWMTWSHPELYRMVHQGIDTTGAMAVSATWARMGQELSEIGDELQRLLFATADAWQGDAAELAKESVAGLAEWSGDTGTRATEVSGCVTIQVDNVTTARNDMPPPPYPILYPAELPSQVTAFTTGDFQLAKPLVGDPLIYVTRERELHEQAARTMERFQANSRDVYATLPQFAPPSLRNVPYRPPQEPPPPPQPPQPPVPTPTPVPRGPGGGPASGGRGTPGGPSGTAARNPTAPLAPGAGTGGAEPAARPAAASSAPARPGAAAPGMAGMPMGGGAGGRGGEDTERKSNPYVEEDPDIWGAHDERVVPPVIGEVNRRA